MQATSWSAAVWLGLTWSAEWKTSKYVVGDWTLVLDHEIAEVDLWRGKEHSVRTLLVAHIVVGLWKEAGWSEYMEWVGCGSQSWW